MTQSPFDQLTKQYLEEFLAPFGKVERQYEIPGEAKFADIWFVPSENTTAQSTDLGILARMAQTPALLEAFRNAPTRREVKTCLLKLLWIQEDEERKATNQIRSEDSLSHLWILAATTTRPVIQAFKGEPLADWLPGIYFFGDGLDTAIVAIDQLPETEETLWLRVLGRDRTQERAVREVLALPPDHPRRNGILKLLANWRVTMNVNELKDFTGREAIMALSQAYLEWEEQVKTQSNRSLILRLLTRRVGELPESARSQLESLPITQLELLAEALLDFSTLDDLEAWLNHH